MLTNGTVKIVDKLHPLIAQGDAGEIQYHFPTNMTYADGQLGYIWLFGTTPETTFSNGKPLTPNTVLQQTLRFRPNTSVYIYNLTPNATQILATGKYTGFLQFVGNNSKPDVYYVPEKNNLDSPYKAVLAVNLDGRVSTQIQQDFVNMQSNVTYSDDLLVPISVQIVAPSISIGEYWENENFVTLYGSTPLSVGTEIKVMLDPDQYVLPKDIRFHTYSTFVQPSDVIAMDDNCKGAVRKLNEEGYNVTALETPAINLTANETEIDPFNVTTVPTPVPIPTIDTTKTLRNIVATQSKCTDPPRIYKVGIPIEWDELAIGAHTFRVELKTPMGDKVSMSKDFLISGSWEMPTPTPIMRKRILTKEGNLVDAPKPRVTEDNSSVLARIVNVTTEATPVVNATINPHPSPTPLPTATVPTEEPTADVSIDLASYGLPVDPVIPLLATLVAIGLVLRRRE
jgi:hypothetical protein